MIKKNKSEFICVICDLENLIGGGLYTASDVQLVKTQIEGILPDSKTAQYVVFSGERSKEATRFGWQNAEVKFKDGDNGADLLLVDRLSDVELLKRSYGEIVVGGGDGKYRDPVARLIDSGLKVTLVVREDSLHRDYKSLDLDVVYIDPIQIDAA